MLEMEVEESLEELYANFSRKGKSEEGNRDAGPDKKKPIACDQCPE